MSSQTGEHHFADLNRDGRVSKLELAALATAAAAVWLVVSYIMERCSGG